MALKDNFPTIPNYIDRRRKATRNRLPRHLRPLALWPLLGVLVLNLGILFTLATLLLNKDDYLSDAGPAITMIVCLLLVIVAIVEGVQMRRKYHKLRGGRIARLNFGLAFLCFLAWAATVAVYLP